ncbi:hypothetical protein [Gordonia humi]|uniref:Uncharacterized protein n=1 Tax=Gordonia humi TaxID=686429 RepID=A0A840F8D3_9ACTN|nr:hypothetical protein [Gordonia humi]MBB4138146.1 hypothetical protein [Gordonia humi]
MTGQMQVNPSIGTDWTPFFDLGALAVIVALCVMVLMVALVRLRSDRRRWNALRRRADIRRLPGGDLHYLPSAQREQRSDLT